jgi:hypothetical protein
VPLLRDVTPVFDIVKLSPGPFTRTPIPVPAINVTVSVAWSAVAVLYPSDMVPKELYVIAPFTVLNVVTPSLFTVIFPEPDVVIPVPGVIAVTPVFPMVTLPVPEETEMPVPATA